MLFSRSDRSSGPAGSYSRRAPLRARALAATVLAGSLLAVTACGGGTNDDGAAGSAGEGGSGGGQDTVIKVASHLPPMTDVVKKAGEVAAEEGYTVELVQVSDNVQYNRLVADGEADASFAQHKPFMEKYNQENDANLVHVASIYDAKVGYYSKDYTSLEEIPQGAKVAIPNDVSNEGRALAILDDHGLITLKEGVGFEGRVGDVEENPKDLEWVQVDLLNLPSAYEEDGIALVYSYPSYIAKVGLTPDDAVVLEENVDQRFSISLVAREDNVDSEKIQVLKDAFTSDQVKEFLEANNTLVPSF